MHSISSEAILLESIGAKFTIYQHLVVGTEITDYFDALNWFQIQQMKSPILTRFAYIILSITPLQNENERDFSLARIYTASRRANIYVEMLPDLLFINRNSVALVRNTTIDVFLVSLDAVADIVNEMESNPDAFLDASETVYILLLKLHLLYPLS